MTAFSASGSGPCAAASVSALVPAKTVRAIAMQALTLPEEVILIDVNGTLFDDRVPNSPAWSLDVPLLRQTIEEFTTRGVAVGLCSDSPSQPLRELARVLHMSDLVIYENGAGIAHAGNKMALRIFPDRQEILAAVSQFAKSLATTRGLHLTQQADVIAPEFGGIPLRTEAGQWAFGAGRDNSIAVFGPSNFIALLSQAAEEWDSSMCFGGCNTFGGDIGVLIFHAGSSSILEGKREALAALACAGHRVSMIGNSMADWIEPGRGVSAYFVANAYLSDAVREKIEISSKPLMAGVIEILKSKLSV